MKKFYEEMQIEIIALTVTDVIATSPNSLDDVADDIFSPSPKN